MDTVEILRKQRSVIYRVENSIVDDVCPSCNHPASVVGELKRQYLSKGSDSPEYECAACRLSRSEARRKNRIQSRHVKMVHTKEYTPGRNDPCCCDSDKKYKKCCGKKY